MRVEPLTMEESISVILFLFFCFGLGFIVKELSYDKHDEPIIIFFWFIVFFIFGYVVRGKI